MHNLFTILVTTLSSIRVYTHFRAFSEVENNNIPKIYTSELLMHTVVAHINKIPHRIVIQLKNIYTRKNKLTEDEATTMIHNKHSVMLIFIQ